jgi:hypothetical protein
MAAVIERGGERRCCDFEAKKKRPEALCFVVCLAV